MENKFLKNPVYQNRDGYDSHDMSQRVSFSSSIGQLLPIYYDFLSPGDKVTINDRMETRTLTLDSSVWTDLTDTIEYFFVPVDQIYSLFGSFYYGVDDRKSSFVTSKANISHYFPTFSIQSVFDQIMNISTSGTNGRDDVGEPIRNGFLRLIDCFGISSVQLFKACYNSDYVHPLTSLFFASYQKIYYDFYRLDDFQPNSPAAYNVDSFYNNAGLITSGISSLMFTLRHRPYQKDFFKNVFRSPLIPAGYADVSESSQSLINSEFMKVVNNWVGNQSSFISVGTATTGSGNTSVSLARSSSSSSSR